MSHRLKFDPPIGHYSMIENGQTTNISTRHQCISAMKQYENYSMEELRFEDYQTHRDPYKTKTTPTFKDPLFGRSIIEPTNLSDQLTTSSSPFGTTTTSSSPFGTTKTSSSPFGTTTTSSSPFGTPTTSSSPFGTTKTSSSPFGTTTTSSSPFGATTTSSSLFGTPTTSSSPFGATTTSSSPFGATTTSSSPFGATTTSSSLFGATTTNSSPFGATTTSSSPFGATTTSSPLFGTPTTSSSLFGTPTTSSSPFGTTKTSSSPFGTTATSSSPFGTTTTSSSLFGTPTTSSSPFGTTTTSSSLFGTPTTSSSPFGATTTSSSPFGATTTSSSPFGTTTTSSSPFGTTTTRCSLFGNPKTSSSPFGTPTTSSSPFGVTTISSSLFGRTTTSSSLFGATTTSSSLFGTPTTSSSLFGATTTSSSLFGATTNHSSLFGATTTSSSQFGIPTTSSSLFGIPTTSSSPFGTTKTNSAPFGTTTTSSSPFGATTTSSSTFGATTTSSSPFGTTATSSFSIGASNNMKFVKTVRGKKGHSPVILTNFQDKTNRHGSNNVEFLCVDCSIQCCSVCLVVHKWHDWERIVPDQTKSASCKHVDQTKEQVVDDRDETCGKVDVLLHEFENSIKHLVSQKEQIQSKGRLEISRIEKEYEEILQKVYQRKLDLIQNVQKVTTEKCEDLDQVIENLTKIQDQAEKTQRLLKLNLTFTKMSQTSFSDLKLKMDESKDILNKYNTFSFDINNKLESQVQNNYSDILQTLPDFETNFYRGSSSLNELKLRNELQKSSISNTQYKIRNLSAGINFYNLSGLETNSEKTHEKEECSTPSTSDDGQAIKHSDSGFGNELTRDSPSEVSEIGSREELVSTEELDLKHNQNDRLELELEKDHQSSTQMNESGAGSRKELVSEDKEVCGQNQNDQEVDSDIQDKK